MHTKQSKKRPKTIYLDEKGFPIKSLIDLDGYPEGFSKVPQKIARVRRAKKQ